MKNRAWYFLVAFLALWLCPSALRAFGYEFAINVSDSIEGRVFFVNRNIMPEKGDTAAVRAPITSRFSFGRNLLKHVVGAEGDTVTHVSGHVYLNGEDIATIREFASNGEPMFPGPVGTIPSNHYFILGTHERSYDSRYKSIGFIPEKNIIGRAYRLY